MAGWTNDASILHRQKTNLLREEGLDHLIGHLEEEEEGKKNSQREMKRKIEYHILYV